MNVPAMIAFAGALAVLAATPGPGVLACTGEALSRNFRSAIAVIAGIVAGDLCYLTFALFGLCVIAESLGRFFIIVRYAGAVYLIWLGYRLWTANNNAASGPPASNAGGEGGRVLRGFAITLGNPKVILFYLGFLPAFMDLTYLTLPDIVVTYLIVATVLGGVMLTYAYAADRARRTFLCQSRLRTVRRCSGALVASAGALILARSG